MFVYIATKRLYSKMYKLPAKSRITGRRFITIGTYFFIIYIFGVLLLPQFLLTLVNDIIKISKS